MNLAYLYPALLNIYGDMGNVLTLEKRCKARGIEFKISPIEIGDKIDSERYDMYFMGGGQDQQQTYVASDLLLKKPELAQAINDGATFLAVCGGYQLLGNYYVTGEGLEIKGIEALDLYTVAGNKRMIGNVLCVDIETNETIVGFENHSGKTYLGNSVKPLAKVLRGYGNNGEDSFEGVRYKNVFGTYLHGSLLPKNPALADRLIKLALERKGLTMPNVAMDDTLEKRAHNKATKLKY